jgi:hypothetical protein
VGEHNILPAWQWAPQTIKGAATHNNRVAKSQILEMAKIRRQMPRQLVIPANDVVL